MESALLATNASKEHVIKPHLLNPALTTVLVHLDLDVSAENVLPSIKKKAKTTE